MALTELHHSSFESIFRKDSKTGLGFALPCLVEERRAISYPRKSPPLEVQKQQAQNPFEYLARHGSEMGLI